ncbi:MAG: RNA polymerase sigma factor [Bacteroidota bacterium]
MEPTIDISKVQGGDEAEIRLLAQSISTWTYNAVLYLLRNVEDTEEIVQDTIIKVLDVLIEGSKHPAGPRQPAALRAWVYQIALNKARDRLRYRQQKKRRARISPLEETRYHSAEAHDAYTAHPGIQLESKEELAFLWRCIDQLPDQQKEALLLVKIDKNSLKVTAELMATTPKAVESLLSRAKANLKTLLQKSKR